MQARIVGTILLVSLMLFLSACGTTKVIVVTAPPSTGSSSTPASTPKSSPTVTAQAKPTIAPTPTATMVVQPPPTPSPTVQAKPTLAALEPDQIGEVMRNSVVHIAAVFGETAISPVGLGAGSGFVYDAGNGYIITNAHVIEGASAIKVALSNEVKGRSAVVVGRSPCDDLAVLKVTDTTGMKSAQIDTSGNVKQGAPVVAIGYPLSLSFGEDFSLDTGNVSQLRVQLGQFEDLIKHDAPINPGNSGGPLVNRYGQVIGINVGSIREAQGQNYAISMAYAKPIIEELKKGRNIRYLGMNLVPNQYKRYYGTDQGVAIVAVASGSPAARVGIQPTDLLLKVENTNVNSPDQVCTILQSRNDGEQIRVQLYRPVTGQILEGELTISKVGSYRAPQLRVVGNVNSGSSEGTDNNQANNGNNNQDKAKLRTIVETNFAKDGPGPWETFDEADYSAQMVNGRYVVTIKTSGAFAYSYPDKTAGLKNGYIGAVFSMEGTGITGVIGRYSPNGVYYCYISAVKVAGCNKTVGNKTLNVINPTLVSSIKPRGINTILMYIENNVLYFAVNGKEVKTVKDNSIGDGGFWGILVGSEEPGFSSAFNYLTVKEIVR